VDYRTRDSSNSRTQTTAQRVLVVEDDPTFRDVIKENLLIEGYQVDAVEDGKSALVYLRSAMPDLIILDLTLPDWDGFDLCRLLRKDCVVPIIILSARGQRADKIKGLGLGADDYITKPTHLGELLARVRAVLRRTSPPPEQLVVGRLVIDFRSQQATSGKKKVSLTNQEFHVLRYLAEHRNQVVSRDELLKAVWGYLQPVAMNRSVDQTVFWLRRKIERDPRHPVFIRTVHGDGYCLSIPDVPEAAWRRG